MSETRLPPVVPLTGAEMLRGILGRVYDEASDVLQPISVDPLNVFYKDDLLVLRETAFTRLAGVCANEPYSRTGG